MKKIMNFSMAALVVMGAILAGCSKNEAAEPEREIEQELEQEPEIEDNIVTVTTTIGLGENDATKALAIDYDAKTLTKTFAVGDEVALVYENTSSQLAKAVATAENISADGKSASFTFTLTNPQASQTVFYYYPAALVDESAKLSIPIENQDGTLDNVESLDYAYDSDVMSGGTLSGSVTLENKFAIVTFTLKDATGTNDITSTITGMTIDDGFNPTYTITRSAAAGPIYVVMRPITDKPLTVTATDGENNYTKSVSAKTYASNNFYQQGLRMQEMSPLTVEALTAGTVKVSITNYSGSEATHPTGMKYSLNGGAKTLITTSTDIPVSADDKVQFYGNGTSTQIYYTNDYRVKIQGAGTGFTCKAYGNIMSLLDEGSFAVKTDLPNQNNIFRELFRDNTTLTDAGDLLLPATTLTTYCYQDMFHGCTALTTVPVLPATTLAAECYYGMFQDCTALTTAPVLPAEKLKTGCYNGMFQGCTALTAAPVLPSETLAEWCYYGMFRGCTALTTAPDLLAPTLVEGCYSYMFEGCTNLYYVTCLATSSINSSRTSNWLSGVAATGSFYLASGTEATWTMNSPTGIPSGWRWYFSDGSHLLAFVTDEDLGKYIGVNGFIYNATADAAAAGTTAVAKIAYVGSDNGENEPYNHGLALSLNDVTGGTENLLFHWKTTQTSAGHSYKTESSTFSTSESGLQYNSVHNNDDYPAFRAAISNNGTARPTNCSAWFLASGYQWKKMIDTAGGFDKLGLNGYQKIYWSSTEYGNLSAWLFSTSSEEWIRTHKDNWGIVRSCLAF